MKVAIMQPYFFPYLGYFSLIKNTDKFILLDTVQFIRHGWIERNRILKQDNGWIYMQVPIIKKNGRETLIRDIQIDNRQNWQQKILAQLQSYKKVAPNYNKVNNLMKELLSHEFNDLVSLNKASIQKVCNYLGLERIIQVFSEIDLKIAAPNAPDEWALNICKALGNVDEYWNPPGGQSFFSKQKYLSAGLKLKFMNINLVPYNQKRVIFETGLSIVDVMMFNSVSEIQSMLDNIDLT